VDDVEMSILPEILYRFERGNSRMFVFEVDLCNFVTSLAQCLVHKLADDVTTSFITCDADRQNSHILDLN